MRTSILSVLSADYVRTAQSKGVAAARLDPRIRLEGESSRNSIHNYSSV